ncbi:hypothetical protein NUW54_g11276 [Trametes sanguinea]|uniref:Uncharacterized protein n=1 Tax=Trametes sanguinea TaxID=158606 RepID=A0ACC1NI64_9APHY|nr:hypothetical protein NUW54_g11276 [Trametes sanguinea]
MFVSCKRPACTEPDPNRHGKQRSKYFRRIPKDYAIPPSSSSSPPLSQPSTVPRGAPTGKQGPCKTRPCTRGIISKMCLRSCCRQHCRELGGCKARGHRVPVQVTVDTTLEFPPAKKICLSMSQKAPDNRGNQPEPPVPSWSLPHYAHIWEPLPSPSPPDTPRTPAEWYFRYLKKDLRDWVF